MVAAPKVYAMLGNESLWETAVRCHQSLRQAQIPHSICGGVAVCLHGYQRNTTDVDIIIDARDSGQVKERLVAAGYEWDEGAKEFRTPGGIAVQFLIAGTPAGKDSEVAIPQPLGDSNVEEREGLSVVRLSRLIEMKIACGTGSMRRTHKDFADVVELIAIRNLDGAFAQHLHKSLRKTFGELVRCAQSGS
ncbi:MAG: hypothetical protein KDA60_05965 [Planctomycetales bacterium]|nr:hypothetical protein [Planctomycetales bacterium]